MKVLFDTHAFIWWDSEPTQLSSRALAVCRDRGNTLLFSVASAWEIEIKQHLGKLNLAMPLADVIAEQEQRNQLQVLPVTLQHVLRLEALPGHHKDPFDRLLIAQAIVEGAVLLSADQMLSRYPGTVLW